MKPPCFFLWFRRRKGAILHILRLISGGKACIVT